MFKTQTKLPKSIRYAEENETCPTIENCSGELQYKGLLGGKAIYKCLNCRKYFEYSNSGIVTITPKE